jgi:hypothetical protein
MSSRARHWVPPGADVGLGNCGFGSASSFRVVDPALLDDRVDTRTRPVPADG